MSGILKRTETYIGLTVVLLSILIGSTNQAFWSIGNLFDLLQSSVVVGIFAMGVLLVLLSGGIDVSFTAIAVFSLYATTKILTTIGFDGHVVWAFLLAAGFGILLGIVNGVFISIFKIPALIATLGTASLFRGIMLLFVGTFIINTLPKGMNELGRTTLFQYTASNGVRGGLSASVLILAAVVLIIWVLLRYTLLGRGIYALGGDATAAKRAGFNTKHIQFFVYGLVGLLSGVGGIVHASVIRSANPFDLIGMELSVIASVVLGGARITGGHGTVLGTILGVFLVVLINNSLILLGVPSYWQKIVIGLLILAGTGISSYQSQRESRVNLLESKGVSA
jgi:simple sugar transport system permease protein